MQQAEKTSQKLSRKWPKLQKDPIRKTEIAEQKH